MHATMAVFADGWTHFGFKSILRPSPRWQLTLCCCCSCRGPCHGLVLTCLLAGVRCVEVENAGIASVSKWLLAVMKIQYRLLFACPCWSIRVCARPSVCGVCGVCGTPVLSYFFYPKHVAPFHALRGRHTLATPSCRLPIALKC